MEGDASEESDLENFDINYGLKTWEPHVLIPGSLWIGSEHSARDSVLCFYPMDVIVSLGSERQYPMYQTYPNIEYYRILIDDCEDAQIHPHFATTYKLISDSIASGKRVLVHCQAGISRSATICIAFLMQHQGMSFEDAYKFVRKQRPCIWPNDGFLLQLQKLEEELKKKKNE